MASKKMTNEDRAREYLDGREYVTEVSELRDLLDAAESRGRAEERAAIVDWMRAVDRDIHLVDEIMSKAHKSEDLLAAMARWIQRGEHTREVGK
jgi:hypothetical protein